ncbi:MAG TPA: BatA and WFA domain-containing protein [Verrucomicrobiae bacterium]|nr:BatA and WFA domain-containing protein [Verrucomicrobiae bacterium]
MRFLSPAAFWFAATLPVVVIFYLLKRRRVVKLVSSTILWQKFLADTQANAPFQKLRHNWLLVLQLLLLVLAILALSRPYFAGHAKATGLRVVILDASASMQSTDVAPSRFEKARAEALHLVDSLKDQEQMLILLAAGNTVVKQSATDDKAILRRAIENCQVTDSTTRLTEALKLADTLVRDKHDPEIDLFSDGAAGDLSEFENKGMNLVYHREGERCNNVGITTLDIRENPENQQERAIYTSVVNFSTNTQQTVLDLLFDQEVVDTRALTLAPGETSPQVFSATQQRDGIFTVRIDAKDDLAADNEASIVSLLPQPIRVLLVSHGNRFMERALRTVPGADVSVATDTLDGAPNWDVVVLDDVTPSVWPKTSVLAFHVVTTNLFEDGWTNIDAPAIVDWKNTHPLLRYINLDNVQISETLGVRAPAWGIPLVETRQTPLLLAGELEHQKIIWVGFDTLQSTWPLRVSFPMFIANAVDWLNPASTKSRQLLLHAGEPFRYALAHPVESVTVTLPGGAKETVATGGNPEIVFGDTTRRGAYHLRAGTNEVAFCVNVLDAAESNTKPREELQLGKFNKVGATEVKQASVEFWHWIAAAALAVLLFEWWYYHRRTV